MFDFIGWPECKSSGFFVTFIVNNLILWQRNRKTHLEKLHHPPQKAMVVKSKLIIPLVVIAHIVSALYYLSIPVEYKYANEELYALWFFGSEYLFFTIVLYLSFNKSPLTQLGRDVLYIETGHILLRAVIYILHYAGLVYSDSRQRLSFFIGYLFLASLNLIRKELFSTCTDKN